MVMLCGCLLSLSGAAQYTPLYESETPLRMAGRTQLPLGSTAADTLLPSPPWTQTTLFKTVAAPTLLAAGGLLTFYDNPVLDRYDVQEARQRVAPNFRTYADDYLIFSPIAVVYGLDAVGIKAQHRLLDRTLRMLTASALSQAIIIPIKHYTQVERPDGSDFRAFPSGHTTQAFVGATFMHKELGHLSPWYSIGAYTTATAMGAIRILNNKHWLSDVLVGAGVGILSTHVAYLIFPGKEDRRIRERKASHLMITPIYNQGSVGLNILLVLH